MTVNQKKKTTRTLPDILDQLGQVSRSQPNDPHLGLLDDLDAVSESRATPEMHERLKAQAQKSEEWAMTLEAAQPISDAQQEQIVLRITEDLNRPVIDLAARRRRRLGYVAAFVSAAATVALALPPSQVVDPVPEYFFQVSYGPSNHSQVIELARTKDGQIINNGRSRYRIQLTPATETTADLTIQAWSVGAKTEEIEEIKALVSGKGGIQLILESQKNLDTAEFLLVTLRRSDAPEPRSPELCAPPTCRKIRIPILSNS
jgi:hypothetical protein